ncbi:hypothetical protein, partial [Eubacterium aggregans]|uniref:hypothetical protein n=1 Tax=Eubacterium aggregans TaxID=81409 RepID=UPI003F2BAAFF
QYDDMQMMVLKESLEAGVDISSFKHPSINWVDMMDESLRQSDRYDARLRSRASFSLPEEQKVRRQGSINQNNQRTTEIRDKPIKTVKGAELSAVAKNTETMYWDRMEEFDARQLLQIGAAERQDFTEEEIQMFANPKFSWQQMQELRLWIEAGIDITLLADKRFDPFQMQEIRLRLEDGMNVSTFAKPEINDVNMWLARHDLENTNLGRNVENAVCKEEAQENPSVKDAEWSAER